MSIGSITNKIRNPLSSKVDVPFNGPDFIDGFWIEELEGPKKKVTLVGNQMPFAPFKFGGKQRIKKDFYPGNSEPSTQILGPEESDQTIRGVLKDIKYPQANPFASPPVPDLKGASLELQELLDSIRIRGNLCRFKLGEWQRYGFIEETEFDLRTISRIAYQIKLSIVGFNAPTNAKFLEKSREVPFAINESLIAAAADFQKNATLFPDSVPRSILDKLTEAIGAVASALAVLTDFVDAVLSTVKDIQKGIERAKGLIKHAINKLKEYKRTLGALFSNPFNTSSSLTGVYANSSYFSSQTASSQTLSASLVAFRAQFNNIIPSLPIGRHLIKQGDTLQSIAVKFYDDSASWKKIMDFNNLTDSVLTNGLLEIPRL